MDAFIRILKKIVFLSVLLVFIFVFVSCGDYNQHIHMYSDEWTSNESHHWHSATCGHTSESTDNAEHTWDQGTETRPTTETEYGIMTYSCSVCGYEKTEQIPKLEHTHTYSNEWTSNDEYHWHGSSCGHEYVRKTWKRN